ncbi:MAG TPA: hypothetical protein VL119_01945 [Acidimicrobiia bacterium]|nr:hypothetical protein [Acidimicrobiia bacterium]
MEEPSDLDARLRAAIAPVALALAALALVLSIVALTRPTSTSPKAAPTRVAAVTTTTAAPSKVQLCGGYKRTEARLVAERRSLSTQARTQNRKLHHALSKAPADVNTIDAEHQATLRTLQNVQRQILAIEQRSTGASCRAS